MSLVTLCTAIGAVVLAIVAFMIAWSFLLVSALIVVEIRDWLRARTLRALISQSAGADTDDR